LSLSLLTLALGLLTAALQSANYEHGRAQNDLKERCSMLEAINGDQAAQILERDCAPLRSEPRVQPSAPEPEPADRAHATPRGAQATKGAAP
jgi:hypothetical protein